MLLESGLTGMVGIGWGWSWMLVVYVLFAMVLWFVLFVLSWVELGVADDCLFRGCWFLGLACEHCVV